MPFKKERYPSNWKEISNRIRFERAGGRCEWCQAKQYACGWRDKTGLFWPTGGSLQHDAAGSGLLPYKEAIALVRHCNELGDGLGLNGERGIVIVLTVAHIDHDTANNSDENLAALCQKCHLTHDAKYHAQNAAATRTAKKEAADALRGQLTLI